MTSFIRKNFLLVSAVALPVIVIVLYVAATTLPRFFVAPPEHDLVLQFQPTAYDYDNGRARSVPSRVAVVVERGQARIVVTEVPGEGEAPRRVELGFFLPRLFRYDAREGRITELDVPLPDDLAERSRGSDWTIPALDRVTLSENVTAPDGYRFESGYDRPGGLAVELFGGRSRLAGPRIERNGRIIGIPEPDDFTPDRYYARRLEFVGWVVR